MLSEREKRVLAISTRLLRKKLGKNADVKYIEGYLRTCSDKGFNEILDMIDFIYSNIDAKYQAKMFKEYIHLCLFIAVNHPKLKPCLVEIIQTFTKYKKVEIDIKPCLSKLDLFIVDKAMNYVIKKWSERPTYTMILEEAFVTSNHIGKYFMDNIQKIGNSITDDMFKRNIRTMLWVGIWMGINDTAYRHQFYYILNKIGNEEIQNYSTEFLFEPKNWYINIYTEGVARTREQWNNNEIPRHQNSLIEQPCVVHKQLEVLKKNAEKYGVTDYD